MTNPDSNLEDLGPRGDTIFHDYESQRNENASAVAAPNEFTFDLSKCANCDNPSVFTLDRPQFETVAFCAQHIPAHYQGEALAASQNAEVSSRVASTKDAPLSGVNDPEAVAKTAPVKSLDEPKPSK